MKIKAYKLAAELGLREQPVLDWLRSHGYPNVRRTDTIRAEVAQAARNALRRGALSAGRFEPSRPPSGAPSPGPELRDPGIRGSGVRDPGLRDSGIRDSGIRDSGIRDSGIRDSGIRDSGVRDSGIRDAGIRDSGIRDSGIRDSGIRDPGIRDTAGFRTTFADLLEQHLPQPAALSRTTEMASVHPAPRPDSPGVADGLRQRIGALERERDSARLERDTARQALDEALLAQRATQLVLDQARAQLAALEGEPDRRQRAEAELERVLLDRSTLRQRLQAAEDERASLEQTCGELQAELSELREAVERFEREERDRQVVEGDLKQAQQREMAWRTRALELERAQQTGANLPVLLQGLGLTEPRQQAELLRALLAQRETASAMLRVIQHVDAIPLQKLIHQKLQEVCAHHVCNQVVALDDKVPLRVDSERRCRVCQGSDDRRWFARMTRECARAGVRRLLVIGGGTEIQAGLRGLSEGQAVDLRLVADEDPVVPARILGRVEGCDLLVLWSAGAEEALPRAYEARAHAEGRAVVRVLGARPRIGALARAVTHRLARDHVLRAL